MADGRVANIVISPGIGCTAFTNTTGKAISATFFAQGISTNTNSKATIAVGTGLTITKNEILWQPSQCIACYSGFISNCPACRAYPDPGKMAQVYTQGVFRSNVGTGRSGTPGYTCGFERCYCGRGWGVTGQWNYCYASCCRYFDFPACFNTCGTCINVECGLYCCYEQHYLSHNVCDTGGVRFARPSDVFVGVGTTFTGYTNPINGTGGAPLWCLRFGAPPWMIANTGDSPWNYACGGESNKEPSGPGCHTPFYLTCFHLSDQGIKCGCDCYSSKCGYEYECFVPMVYGGTEVINPAIALTTPPLYNGEYSGFPNANGGSQCCTCYHGAMWASQVTGWFPGQEENCFDWCCAYFCGTQNSCQEICQRQQGHVCGSGFHGTHYLLTGCNTPNALDAAKRLVAPKDDTGVGAGMTGKPFCYCGNQPAFDNTQGGNPLYLQSNCSVFGHSLNVNNFPNLTQNCENNNTPVKSAGVSGSWMVDWYALTDYCNWCHCKECVGRLTLGDPGCYQCNPLSASCNCCYVWYCCVCGAGTQDRCEITCCGGTVANAVLPERKVLAPIVSTMWYNGWGTVIPRLCIKPGANTCGQWVYCREGYFTAYSYGCSCQGFTYSSDSTGCYSSPIALAQTFHMGNVFTSGGMCCCQSGIFGRDRCCYACYCWYRGCCCGPCMGAPYNRPMGCCGFMLPWNMCQECTCWQGIFRMRYQDCHGRTVSQARPNPYGFHHGISCGLIMHYTGDQTWGIYPAAMDWLLPYCWNDACGCYQCRSASLPIRIPLGDNHTYCVSGCCSGADPGNCKGPDMYVYCAANICEGLSNYWFKQCSGGGDMSAKCWKHPDDAGSTPTCCCIINEDGAPMCAWSCISSTWAGYGTELAVKYFAYNPDVDCHYFMARTAKEYANFWWLCIDKCFGPSSAATQADLDKCFYSGIKKCLFTREWCCGIFSIDCRAVMCYYEMRCNCECSMRYDGRDKHPQYKDYPVWGSAGAEMLFSCCCDTTNNCLCCQCYNRYYNSKPCCLAVYCYNGYQCLMTLEAAGGPFCASSAALGGAPCWSNCKQVSGLGTVFFRKVANFPSIMTDYKYTQPRMCVGCLFRSDTSVWSLPVYNHCCFRWDAFITCDLINWNKQELEITCNPTDQMTATSFCQILSLENNYYCKCTDCFMAGFDRSGLLELCMSFNQYERTGLVISNGDSVYVKSNNTSAGITDCFNFQIWGYEG